MAAIQPVTIPQWGLTMTDGTLVKWNASEGDEVKEKDEIAEIETEKIVNVLESPSGGILDKDLIPSNQADLYIKSGSDANPFGHFAVIVFNFV